ncbi:MAG: hypothetical protein KIT56_09915, partial [Gammaproteobacteria bacterium]|nr:hypothetical protein [Gammaproteobacteria bacterium]
YDVDSPASAELNKLNESLNKLEKYLIKLDELQPHYTTDEIERHMIAINLNLDILRGELEKNDYVKLRKGVKVIKLILKFHPTKYSFFEFIISWVYELTYFI